MAYLNYNCEGYLGGNKRERDKERRKMEKCLWEKGRRMMGREGIQICILAWGVPPSAGGANNENYFHHAFFLVLFPPQWDLLKLPIGYSCF